MRYFLGQTQLYPNTPFQDQSTGIKYPGTWLTLSSAEDRAAIGITELDDLPVEPAPLRVPQSVTKRQLYRGLMHVGWLGTTMPQIDAAINAMIGAMPEPPREVARVEFFTSRDYLRQNPLLLSALMSPPLSKTVEEVDDFFRLCGSFAPEGEG